MNETQTDKTIQCKDCSCSFNFSVSEQEFYKLHEYSEPKRCKTCRQRRRIAQEGRR